MIKLTKEELDRCERIFSSVWQAIYYDIDQIEGFRATNRNCMTLCMDYVYAYAPNKDADDAFMRELYERIGWKDVIKQLCKSFSLV